LKRYELTQKGKALLLKQKKIRRHLREEVGFLPAPFFDSFLMKISPEKKAEITEAIRNLAIAFFDLGTILQEEFSQKAIDEANQVLNEAAKKLGKITDKLKGEKHE